MTIPNMLTLLRLGLAPVAAVLAYSPTFAGRAWALGVFAFAMATDAADGYIARFPGQRSRLGLYLDPVVDKTFILTMLFVLADLDLIPLWMACLMLARELLVAGLRSAAATSGGQVVGANRMGKTKGFLQTLCICLGLGARALSIEPALAHNVCTAALGGTLLLVWVFAGIFVWRNRSLLSEAG